MTTIATWGSFNFDDTEVTSWEWDAGMTQVIKIEKISGYPSTQTVGDTLDKISVGLVFRGSTARARLNTLTNFTLAQAMALQLGTTPFGNFKMVGLNVDYKIIVNSNTTAIACKLALEKDA